MRAVPRKSEYPLALVQGFRNLGYVEGKNIVFEHRFPNEQPERFVSLAHELVGDQGFEWQVMTHPAALHRGACG